MVLGVLVDIPGVVEPGLEAADLNLGPYVVALTPHRVVAAPYHRLAKGILANHAILDAELDGAETAMRGLGVDYIAVCNRTGTLPGGSARSSLREALLGNRALGFLEPVEGTSKAPIRVWRRSPP
jgi:hypothetical protein